MNNTKDRSAHRSIMRFASEDNIAALLNCIYEAICVLDVDGTVIIWNKGAEKLYQVSACDIIDHNIEEFFPDALVEKVRKTRQAEENISHCPREGSHIFASARPLYLDGKFCGAVSSDRDHAEVIRLSADLEHAESRLSFLETELKAMSGSWGDFIGSTPNIVKLRKLVRQVAPSNTSVMISGESGTGKEVFARKIHELSGREGLFVPINCSAIPSELFESEFFGYSPGAFTGASRKGKMGYFEFAHNGTLFLDEIGDMPLYMQAKLLRALQEREFIRVGGQKSIKVDVRVISATNKQLRELVEEEKFREDLFYRLNVVEINLPPLRSRKEDIPLFLNHFIREFSSKNKKNIRGVQRDVIDLFIQYDWPGNIRELMNVVENIVVTTDGNTITKENISDFLLSKLHNPHPKQCFLGTYLASKQHMELDAIKKALKLADNNKAQAARLLGIPRSTLYRRLKEYGLIRMREKDESRV